MPSTQEVSVFYTSPQLKHFSPSETYSFVWVFILWPLFAISCRYLSFYALIVCPTFPYPHYLEIAFKAATSNSINSTEYPMCVWVQGWMLSHLPLCHHPPSSTSSGTRYALSIHLIMNGSVISQKSTVTYCLPDEQTLICIVSNTPHLCLQVSRQSQIARLLV